MELKISGFVYCSYLKGGGVIVYIFWKKYF